MDHPLCVCFGRLFGLQWDLCGRSHMNLLTCHSVAHQNHCGLECKTYICFFSNGFEIAKRLNGSSLLWTLKPGKCVMCTAQALAFYSLIPFICTKSCSVQWGWSMVLSKSCLLPSMYVLRALYTNATHPLCLDAENASNCQLCRWCLEHP